MNIVAKNLLNKKFGRLIVIRKTPERKSGSVVWLCRCECGDEKRISSHSLVRGSTKSCGCLAKQKLAGKKYGKLTVIKELPDRDKYKRIMWLCKCDCGNDKIVPSGDLTGGFLKSCGCLRPIPKIVKCDFCGKSIQRRPSRVFDKNFCNRKCQALWQSENKSGGNHPNWKGGISQLPYCPAWGRKEFKEMIKIRDDYKCQNPDCWNTDNNICIHHIDYDKMNCVPENLITICRSCNARANSERSWHNSYYKTVMYRKGISL